MENIRQKAESEMTFESLTWFWGPEKGGGIRDFRLIKAMGKAVFENLLISDIWFCKCFGTKCFWIQKLKKKLKLKFTNSKLPHVFSNLDTPVFFGQNDYNPFLLQSLEHSV